jgi:penicillin-binding protein 1A
MVSKYGDDQILDQGVNIYTTLDSKLQTKAQDAIKDELKALDKKQGFRGPTKRLKGDKEIEQEIAAINKDIADSVRNYIYFPEPWQEFKIKNKMFVVEDKQNAQDLSKAKVPVPLDKGINYKAVVLGINDKAQEIKVSVGYTQGVIRKEGFSWVYREKLNNGILRRGDVILVTLLKPGVFAIEQEPLVESALLSFNISDGSIIAMVGGYSFEGSEFNRAYQAKRQAGSTFKPLVYSAALDKGYTPATVIMDSPIVYEDEGNATTWKPTNYSEEFYGDTTVRDAIVFSRNIPTTKILQDIKVSYAKEYAKRLGIRSEMPNDLSLGLGSAAVSLWEMTKAFSVFASGGKRVIPYFITKIDDRSGKVLEQYDPSKPVDYIEGADQDVKTEKKDEAEKPQEAAKEGEKKIDLPPVGYVVPPQTAYLMNFLLKEAASKGTGSKAAAALNIPLAGKTGTSNDFCDAWFIGYTPHIMTGVWVGYDDQSKSLGQGETGAEVSVPIWIDYMKEATSKTPKNDFVQPEGIKYLKIDGKTGKVASRRSAKIFYMPFKEGTEPTQVEGESGDVNDADETQFFRENF